VAPAFKIALLVLVFLALAPLQWLAMRLSRRLAGRIPMLFHAVARRTLGLTVRQVGAMARDRPLLIVANHTSWLDIVVLGSVAPISFIAKSEVSTWPAVRTLAKMQRTIFVDRTRRSATGAMVGSIGARLGEGDPIVLFAEGTTSDGNRVFPFRSALIGAATAPEGDGAFVQPAVLAYPRRFGLPPGRSGRPQIAWYGDMELGPHLWPLLRGGGIEAVLVWGEARPAAAAGDRKALAGELEDWARRAYSGALHGRV
jgi:1-acyl-sn-glycerol-3-phosphate acyltransferase